MRELKFRVWFQDKMTYLKQTVGKYDYENGIVLSFSDDGYDEFGAHERFDVGKDLPPFMQFTGLKDKNSKEIYEGDVVLKYGKPVQVIWVDDSCGFEPFSDSMDNCGHCGNGLQSNTIEVIGNIYENPELLK